MAKELEDRLRAMFPGEFIRVRERDAEDEPLAVTTVQLDGHFTAAQLRAIAGVLEPPKG